MGVIWPLCEEIQLQHGGNNVPDQKKQNTTPYADTESDAWGRKGRLCCRALSSN